MLNNHWYIQRRRSEKGNATCYITKYPEVKNTFIVPTDAQYYKIIEMLEQFKIITLAPTCFGSRRNHHQGAVLCLAKSAKWFFCARRCRRSQCYGGISACSAGVRFTVDAAQFPENSVSQGHSPSPRSHMDGPGSWWNATSIFHKRLLYYNTVVRGS
jgi:hypothetical protein